MAQNKNVYVKRKCNAVSIVINVKTPEGEFITKWMETKNIISKECLGLAKIADSYTIKVTPSTCLLAKRIAKELTAKIQSVLSNM